MLLRSAITIIGVLVSASLALAVECRSLGGHLNGEPVTSATRHATLNKGKLTLTGTFNGVTSPRRILNCSPLAAGILCERVFGPVLVTVITNGKRMIETVKALETGQEQAGLSYLCNGTLKF